MLLCPLDYSHNAHHIARCIVADVNEQVAALSVNLNITDKSLQSQSLSMDVQFILRTRMTNY